MQKRLLLSFVCLLGLITNVLAQSKGVISGTVRDEDSGETLIGVSIYEEKLQLGTTTDEKGRYELELPFGEHTLRVSYVGYSTINKRVNIGNKPVTLNLKLESEQKKLSEVEVTSERKDRNVTAMAMSVQTLDMITIKKIPALMGEVDVIKSITLLPGVQSVSEGSSGFSVRGGATDQNLILLDGAPIYNASHFLGFFSVFNNDAVKDATLYKGDIPANFGGRLSSVLDVAVKDDMPKRFSLQGGIGLVTSRLMLETPLFDHKTSVMLAGRRTYAGLVLPFLGEDLNKSRINFYDINAKVTQSLGKNDRLFLSFYNGHDEFNMQQMIGLGYGNSSATLRWSHIFSDRLTSNLSLIGSRYRYSIDVNYSPYDFGIKAGTDAASLNYDFAMHWNDKHVSKFGLTTGIQSYLQGEIDDRGGALSQYLQIDQSTSVARKGLEHALYFTHDYSPTPRLTFRAGLRLSCFQNIGEEDFYLLDDVMYVVTDTLHYGKGEVFNTMINPEPRVAAKFQLDEHSSVKASYSRTVQYAQIASSATGGLPFDVWFPTSPNVKPQKCDQFALGYFRNFGNDAIETSVEVYYKNMQNVIDFKDNAITFGYLLIDGQLRVGKGRSYGAEFLIRKNVGKFTGWISYTYARSFRTIKGISYGREYRSPYDRPHNIVIVGSYEVSPRITLAANWIYNTGQPVTFPYGQYTLNGVTYAVYNGKRNESRYPDYHRLDLSFTCKLGKLENRRWQHELNVSVYNAYARHNTWAITFDQGKNGSIITKNMYLFSAVPSISYNFKY
ncbi:MAG: TonB-dependent receptor [Bacteroidales bacterium]|nr:TonB-dependent receptor [Bacteroidales bacterium]